MVSLRHASGLVRRNHHIWDSCKLILSALLAFKVLINPRVSLFTRIDYVVFDMA